MTQPAATPGHIAELIASHQRSADLHLQMRVYYLRDRKYAKARLSHTKAYQHQEKARALRAKLQQEASA